MKRNLPEMKTGFRDESGQTLVLVVLCSLVLMGFLGLAIDVGNARTSERKMQQAADAAAIAGILESSTCGASSPCTEMTTASKQAVIENGLSVVDANVYTNTCTMPAMPSTTGTPLLVVNYGPCLLGSTSADPNYGSTNYTYVEAAVAENQPAYFANVFGIHTFAVSARAEAKINNSPWCIFAKQTIQVDSGGQLTASCGAYSDGTLTSKKGSGKSCNGTHITVTAFDVAGSACNSNQITPTPVSPAPILTDPLSYLGNNFTPPSSVTSACQSSSFVYPWGTKSPITPGTGGSWTLYASSTYAYCAASGYALKVSSGDTVTLAPGPAGCSGTTCNSTFVFNGNVDNEGTLQSSSTSGVTLYFTGTSGSVSGGGSFNLYAPTGCGGGAESWTNLPGILYWANANDPATLSLGNGQKETWQGAIYLPGGELDDASGSNLSMGAYSILDANIIFLSDGAKVNADYSSLCGGSPVKTSVPTLAE